MTDGAFSAVVVIFRMLCDGESSRTECKQQTQLEQQRRKKDTSLLAHPPVSSSSIVAFPRQRLPFQAFPVVVVVVARSII
jgi:hypothetical protein